MTLEVWREIESYAC